jgi:transposase
MKFESGDEALVKALLADGMTPSEVASKWGVHICNLKRFCAKHNIEIRTSDQIELAVVDKIVKMHSSHAVDVIARIVNRSEKRVREILKTYCSEKYVAKHISRRNAVVQLSEAKGLSLSEACKALGISYGEFDYSRRIANKAIKKAANKSG